jgi:hypothetical protein
MAVFDMEVEGMSSIASHVFKLTGRSSSESKGAKAYVPRVVLRHKALAEVTSWSGCVSLVVSLVPSL